MGSDNNGNDDNTKNVGLKKNFTDGGGERLNKNKLRYDLVHPKAHEDLVKTLTKGAEKYADRNWERGMNWSTVLESLKRHISAFEKGDDYDFDPECEDCKKGTCVNHTGLLHVSLASCNLHFLNAYYYMYPQGDNRAKRFLNLPKIGLDIDGVLADWMGAWRDTEKRTTTPESWCFDANILDKIEAMRNSVSQHNTNISVLDEFYLGIDRLVDPCDIPFEPDCYITARPVDTAITIKWLELNGFPIKPVYTVPPRSSKVEAAKEAGVEIFIDDSYTNFIDLTKNGITTYLFTTEQNKNFDVGHLRLNSLKDLPLL